MRNYCSLGKLTLDYTNYRNSLPKHGIIFQFRYDNETIDFKTYYYSLAIQ